MLYLAGQCWSAWCALFRDYIGRTANTISGVITAGSRLSRGHVTCLRLCNDDDDNDVKDVVFSAVNDGCPGKLNPLTGTLKPQTNGPSYSNTLRPTVTVYNLKNMDGWGKIRPKFGLAELSRKLTNSAKIRLNTKILRLKFS